MPLRSAWPPLIPVTAQAHAYLPGALIDTALSAPAGSTAARPAPSAALLFDNAALFLRCRMR